MPTGLRKLTLCMPFRAALELYRGFRQGWPDSLLFSLTASEGSQIQINILWWTTDAHEKKGQTQVVIEPRTPGVEVRRVNL